MEPGGTVPMWIIGHAERRFIELGGQNMTQDADENRAMNALFMGMCGRSPVPAPEPAEEPEEGQLRLNLKPGGSNENAEMNQMLLRIANR
jgi:hypothetical protein